MSWGADLGMRGNASHHIISRGKQIGTFERKHLPPLCHPQVLRVGGGNDLGVSLGVRMEGVVVCERGRWCRWVSVFSCEGRENVDDG